MKKTCYFHTAASTGDTSPELHETVRALKKHPARALIRAEAFWLACCVGEPNKQDAYAKLLTAQRMLMILDQLPAPSTWTNEPPAPAHHPC